MGTCCSIRDERLAVSHEEKYASNRNAKTNSDQKIGNMDLKGSPKQGASKAAQDTMSVAGFASLSSAKYALAASVPLGLLVRCEALWILPLALVISLISYFLWRRCPDSRDGDESATQSVVVDERREQFRWSFIPSTGVFNMNAEPAIKETDVGQVKMFLMHRPTFDKPLDASGLWPFGWHFSGRKRLWELRAQVRMKVARPAGKMYFGIEMCPGEAASGHAGRVRSMIQTGIRMTIGKDFYTCPGDAPHPDLVEQEVCHLVMPMWALDQFIISEPGEEPALEGSLEGLGNRRTQGKAAYIKAMSEMEANLSTEKVYTFCFWGISRFVDLEQWCCQGFGAKVDAGALTGAPPVFVVGYWLRADEEQKVQKHLNSNKTYLCRAALWNDRSPPQPGDLRKAIGREAEESPPKR